MKTDFLNFYEEEIQPEIECIREDLESAKKYDKKMKKIYLKIFLTSLVIYIISIIFNGRLFGVTMLLSMMMMGFSAGFGIVHTIISTFLLYKIRKSYDNEYYSDILPNILYRFNHTFRKSEKITFPEELYRNLHIEKLYKKYNSSKCIIGHVDGSKAHIARIKTKAGLLRTKSIVFKVALKNNFREKTFLISSRHHKKTNRDLPKKNFNLGENFNKRICIYTKKKNLRESCLSDVMFRQNIMELHDILEGNISIYVINNNIYFKLNLDKNIFNKNFFKLVDADYFLKYEQALEKIKELVVNLNYYNSQQ